LGLADQKYQITAPAEEMGEDEKLVEVERTETPGCVVALCEFATVAQARRMHEALVGVLESLRIAVIQDEEASRAVPRLKAGEDVFLESVCLGKPITVRDVFFFMMP
jgi:hypothetical protein